MVLGIAIGSLNHTAPNRRQSSDKFRQVQAEFGRGYCAIVADWLNHYFSGVGSVI